MYEKHICIKVSNSNEPNIVPIVQRCKKGGEFAASVAESLGFMKAGTEALRIAFSEEMGYAGWNSGVNP